MKLHSKATYYLSILSLGIILFLFGLSALISLHSERVTEYLKQQQSFVIDLEDDLIEADLYVIQKHLQSDEHVDTSSVSLISKAEGLEIMKKELGDPNLFLGIDNPLQDIIEFKLEDGDLGPEQIEELKKDLTSLSGVVGFHYQDKPYKALDMITKHLNRILNVLAILLLGFSLALIYITLRLMLVSQEKRIFTMQMVGAKDSFILRPYIRTGLSIGFWAGIFSVILLIITFIVIVQYFSIPAGIIKYNIVGFVMGSLMILGCLFSALSAYMIVSKYLGSIDKSSNTV